MVEPAASATILSLAHKGDGVADLDGRQVFVEGGVPGDVVQLHAEGDRARIVDLLNPSPHRAVPPCPHFGHGSGACGGCSLQHLNEAFVCNWKRELVVSALQHRGIDAEVTDTVTLPSRSRRRAVFAARRKGSGVIIGFHEKSSPQVVDTPSCEVVDPAIMAALPALAQVLSSGLSRRGEAKVSVLNTDSGFDVAVELPGKPLTGSTLTVVSDQGAKAGLARLSWNGEQVAEWVPPTIEFDGIQCVPPPGGFLQAVAAAEDTIRRSIQDAIKQRKRVNRVVDLFCGCGAFTLPLARLAKVDAFDSDGAAISSLNNAFRKSKGLKPVTAERRDLFRRPVFAPELSQYDFAVIDPPRAGAVAQIEQLAKSTVPTVVSVSCNPATFARDARVLVDAGFELGPVTPIDQFRWSSHVELVAVFQRN